MRLKTIKIIIGFTVLTSFYACNKPPVSNGEIKTINLNETKDILPISSFIKDVDYLKFNFGDDDRRIGVIKDLKFLDNEIILEQQVSRETSFLRFSKKGKFLNQIVTDEGEGGKILNPRDIIKFQNGFAVWDKNAVHTFNKAGKYKQKVFDAEVPGNSFCYADKNFYLFHETTAPGFLSQYSSNGNLKQVFKPNNFSIEGIGYSKIEAFGKDSLHLFTPINDTVFSFSKNRLAPVYNFEGDPFPTFSQLLKAAGDREPKEMLRYINENRHVVVSKYLENENFIFIQYRLGSYPSHILIKKASWEITYFRNASNDIDGGIWKTPLYLNKNDELFFVLDSYEIERHKILNKRKKNFKKLKEKMTSKDKLVLMVCKLK